MCPSRQPIVSEYRRSLAAPNAASNDVIVAKLFDGQSGDFNGNGTVDAADFITVRHNNGWTLTTIDGAPISGRR
jgi:hypothetical protein